MVYCVVPLSSASRSQTSFLCVCNACLCVAICVFAVPGAFGPGWPILDLSLVGGASFVLDGVGQPLCLVRGPPLSRYSPRTRGVSIPLPGCSSSVGHLGSCASSLWALAINVPSPTSGPSGLVFRVTNCPFPIGDAGIPFPCSGAFAMCLVGFQGGAGKLCLSPRMLAFERVPPRVTLVRTCSGLFGPPNNARTIRV